MTRHHYKVVVAVCLTFAAESARAESFNQAGPTRQGHVQFILVGASMVDNQGLGNGVNCLWPSATTVITAADLPPRAELVQATLYPPRTVPPSSNRPERARRSPWAGRAMSRT